MKFLFLFTTLLAAATTAYASDDDGTCPPGCTGFVDSLLSLEGTKTILLEQRHKNGHDGEIIKLTNSDGGDPVKLAYRDTTTTEVFGHCCSTPGCASPTELTAKDYVACKIYGIDKGGHTKGGTVTLTDASNSNPVLGGNPRHPGQINPEAQAYINAMNSAYQ
mmetsp:Transcript_2080/g.3188  ORF Transcript_2080/g.3188 Transcript_2080/m.3188 type:complete len:163 (-) Transcript_2080:184-672(-)|eukprot:CAMPEP_0194201354 /NCGR_PEP_ID=MMETSP0156-20130528/1641_1 /TAXON_ID=33649 /ORGANISM="Thalassionema nitzschioides, Strain L26-B" /LENGTH=162 /DNA_ID=CAMNT_0038926523 /DNA_START=97 /DNA_END=585 /DNA_ORIENTATION=+